MKKFTFKGVLDGFRSSVAQQVKPEQEIVETLRSEHFQVKKTFRHGFPYQPSAMAFDPIQRLLAIGTKSGSLRILGRPGVDVHVKHESDCAVTQIEFLINEGALISATNDDTVHLWNFRQKIPQVVQSLKFQRERITCIHLPLQSKWLYVGTERGNVHILHIETFVLSGYVINWNKAIEVSRKTHPGSVIHLSDNPFDLNKMLIGYESGQIVLWDLKIKVAEFRWQTDDPLRSISWHHEGKQFICSHTTGSLTTWLVRQPKYVHVTYPHAKNMKDGEPEPCKAIQKVEWKVSRSGEAYIVFSGGLAFDSTGRTPSITVIQGKTTTVLEMEQNIVDFITLCDSPWSSDFQDPYAVVVLLQNDLVVIDLLTTGFPCFENPYPMDLHESPVTCCAYFADCPGDLIPAFYSVGSKSQKKTGFSEKEWPVSGGEWSPNSSSYNEIVLTGHADGSIKFWDASAGTLQVLYKLKTAKLFEKNKTHCLENNEDPLAIQLIFLCPESRKLAIASVGCHIILFKFKKIESMSEVVILEVPLVSDSSRDMERSPDFDFSNISDDPKVNAEKNRPLKVKSGMQKRAAGFQATLVCLTYGPNGELPENITALSLNSSYGLLAYGNDTGLIVVDIVQKISLLVMCTSDFGNNIDPHQRALRSPKRHEDISMKRDDDKARSPSIDQSYISSQHTRHLKLHLNPKTLSSVQSSNLKKVFSEGSHETLVIGCASVPESGGRTPDFLCGLQCASDVLRPTNLAFETVNPEAVIASVPKSTMRFKRVVQSLQVKRGQVRLLSVPDIKYQKAAISEVDTSGKREALEFVHRTRPTDESSASGFTSINDTFAGNFLRRFRRSTESGGASGIAEGDYSVICQSNITADETAEEDIDGGGGEKSLGQSASSLFRRSDAGLIAGTCGGRHGSGSSGGGRTQGIRKLQKCLSTSVTYYETGIEGSSSGFATTFPFHAQRSIDIRGYSATTYPQASLSSSYILTNTRQYSSFDKLDSSFQRSRSSSMSSLENIATETVSCLTFADSYTKKSDANAFPTLWIGTFSGSVQTIVFNTPASGDRHAQPVVISSCNGSTFKLKGCILTMSFLDCFGALIPYSYESWKDENTDSKDRNKNQGKFLTTRMSSSIHSQGSGSDSYEDRQFIVLTSQKQAKVIALPSQNCIYKQQLTDTNIVIKAEITSLKDSVCLVCYVSNGHICSFSLPSLRPLLDIDFVPVSNLSFNTIKHGIVDPMLSIWGHQLFVNGDNDQVARTLCFSNRGHGFYLSSPTEIQKFTISSEFCSELTEMMGDLFIGQDMPEPPKESFFKGLFGGGTRSIDREELFGEASGKASKTVANRIPGPNMSTEGIRERVSIATNEVIVAHQMIVERGEKLSQLEDRTARMMNESENFASSAHTLMLKYKDKKWYQL